MLEAADYWVYILLSLADTNADVQEVYWSTVVMPEVVSARQPCPTEVHVYRGGELEVLGHHGKNEKTRGVALNAIPRHQCI